MRVSQNKRKSRSKIQISKLIVLAILLLFSAGCDTAQDQISESGNSDGTGGAATQDPGSSAKSVQHICTNEYYPVDPSTSREFRMSADSGSTYVLVQEEIKGDTFVEKRKFSSGLEIVNNWQCTEEGLRNVEFNNSATNSQMKFDMETLESTGITLPRVWEVGKKWTSEYKVSAKLNAGPVAGGADGTVVIQNEIAAMDEKISVAAGEYNGARVDSEMVMNLTMNGRKLPSSKFTMSNWYVVNVGLVKQTAKTPFGSETVEFAGNK